MAEIGKFLVFYLKYFPQMQHIYEEGEWPQELKSLSGREVTANKIKEVGKAAGAEAADLLKICFEDVASRLAEANVARLSYGRREAVERKWSYRINLAPNKSRKKAGVTRQIGIELGREGLTPWVWSLGGLEVEDRLRHLLGTRVTSFGSSKMGWYGGCVSLETIPIPWQSAKGFSLDAEDIIKRTKKVCEAISPAFVRKFIRPLMTL
jgi:hypothetical protein